MKLLPPAQQFVQTLVLAQLEQNVDVFGVLEKVFEPDDVVVVEGAVNFDLRHELLLGS